jgi:hypothetical protein
MVKFIKGNPPRTRANPGGICRTLSHPSEPDQPAKAYLTVIARDPEGVERALHPVPDWDFHT